MALEVKIGNDGSAIYDAAVQLPRYWERHESGEDEYRVGGELIEPDVFAVATGNAPLGRRYNDDPSVGVGSLYSSALVDYQYGPDDTDPALCYRTASRPKWKILRW